MNLCARIITELKVPAAAGGAGVPGAPHHSSHGMGGAGAPPGPLSGGAPTGPDAYGVVRPTAVAAPPPLPPGSAAHPQAALPQVIAYPPLIPNGPPRFFLYNAGACACQRASHEKSLRCSLPLSTHAPSAQ